MPSLQAVDYDPFAQTSAPQASPAEASGPLRLTVHPAPSEQPRLVPVDHDPFADAKQGVVEDVVKSGAAGVGKGVASVLGAPGSIRDAADSGLDALFTFIAGKLGATPEQVAAARDEVHAAVKKGQVGFGGAMPNAKDVQAGMETVTGEFHKPQTTPGKYAETIGEFLPTAGRNVVSMAVLPGIASEAAGQATEGTKLEPFARAGAAIATGGVAAALSRPSTPERAIRAQLPANTDRAAVQQAQNLMQEAQQRGIALTWPEALEKVAPGTGLTNMQRVIESSPGSRQRMGEFMAERPGQIDAAARRQFDQVAAPSAAPSNIGPAVGAAAEDTVNGVHGAINDFTKPLYDKASTVLLKPAEMAQVQALPGFDEARKAIRKDPQLNRYVDGLPDNSVGFLNEVKKFLDNAAENAASPVQQGKNMQRAAGYGKDASTAASIGSTASPDYATALAVQAHARETYLQPLLNGPLGKIAARDTTTKAAMDALFPSNPLPGSADEIATAVSALAKRSPKATRELIRAKAESVFNESAQNLQPGANQFGGAKFAKEIAGNPQQRANLEAAVKASGPDGDKVWNGFDKFLQIVEATGTRQAKGSLTAFNAQELKDMSSGGLVGNAIKTGASPQKWLTAISDGWSRWQLGNNLDQLAHILTDPNSAGMLKAIASRPTAGREALILAGRLAGMAYQVSANKTNKPQDAGNQNRR